MLPRVRAWLVIAIGTGTDFFGRQVGKAGDARFEPQAYFAGRTVAPSGHDQFGQAIDALHRGGPGGVCFVNFGLVAIDRACPDGLISQGFQKMITLSIDSFSDALRHAHGRMGPMICEIAPNRRFGRAMLMSCALAATSVPAWAETVDAPAVSWGKVDITYAQYRADALDCANRGFAAKIDQSAPVSTLRNAADRLDTLNQRSVGVDSTHIEQRAKEEQTIKLAADADAQYKRIKQLMFAVVRQCMTERGYTRFALTPDQRAAMRAIRGDDPRRAFLFRLATDPIVLDKQKYASVVR